MLSIRTALCPRALVVNLSERGLANFLVSALLVVRILNTRRRERVINVRRVDNVNRRRIKIHLRVSSATVRGRITVAIRRMDEYGALTEILRLQIERNRPSFLRLVLNGRTISGLSINARRDRILLSFLCHLLNANPRSYALSVRASRIRLEVRLNGFRNVFALTTSRLRRSEIVVIRVRLAPLTLRVRERIVCGAV